MERRTLFADVVLPLAIPNTYTYRIPYEWNEEIKVGQRVVVQFGKNKLFTALVKKIHEQAPQKYAAKYIENILDPVPVVNTKQFAFWEWMASYYMCNEGEVMNAALPSGLKLSSETKIVRSAERGERDTKDLTDKEYMIWEALELREVITMDEASQILEQKTVYPVIRSLIEKGLVSVEEELKEKYKPKMESWVKLIAEDGEKMKKLFDDLEKKAPKQLDILMAFMKVAKEAVGTRQEASVKKSELLKMVEGGEGAIKALVKKGVFELYEKETGRLGEGAMGEEGAAKQLNEEQVRAMAETQEHFKTKEVVLMHGVTSSGKTEVYIKLIEQVIAEGKQVLYLLPEIALTAQIIRRLQKHFGNKVGVYHSRFSVNERVEVWNRVGSRPSYAEASVGKQSAVGNYQVVLGARSALFLPFDDLGLVIVDEEHDTSYKQFDPSPRYNARDSAIYLAHLHKAKVLLGSATPSIESYYNAADGKYGLVKLIGRFGGMEMPEIITSDLREARKKKQMKSHFSPLLLDTARAAYNNKEQVIFFQNRRGFAPVLECGVCAWVPQCLHCDVSLTYHKTANVLRCHYCGYSIAPPSSCSACGSNSLKMKGFGTEKIEEELAVFFPEARIARMDLDTTRSKFAYHHIIQDFEDRNIDILVGTQMVTKGLDFDHVSLVGILDADGMLSFPDFRAHERSYQLMSQVSGRAGRKTKRGKVIIQSANPEHPIIKHVIDHDYEAMYREELADRKNFQYPPFYRLIEITLKHKDADALNHSAEQLAEQMRKAFGKRVLGPEFPSVSRVRNFYLKTILLKLEREAAPSKAKDTLNQILAHFRNEDLNKQTRVHLDVDPM